MASDRRRSLTDSVTSEKPTSKTSTRAAQATHTDARQKSTPPQATAAKAPVKATVTTKVAVEKKPVTPPTKVLTAKAATTKPNVSTATKKAPSPAVKATPTTPPAKPTQSAPATTAATAAAPTKATVAIPKPEKTAVKPVAKSGGFRPGLGKTLGSTKQSTPPDKPPRVLPPGSYVLDEQVGYQLRRAHQRATTIFHEVMAAFDVTPTQFAALAKVDDEGPISQNHLGRLTAMDPSTILGVVGRLQRQGLVHLRSTPGDARLTMIELTTDGKNKVADMKIAAANVTKETLSPLSAEEAKTLTELLTRIG